MKITLISMENCPKCANLARYLEAHNAAFEVDKIDPTNGKDLTRLMVDYGFFGMSLPALMVGSRLYEFNDLFSAQGNVMDLTAILSLPVELTVKCKMYGSDST
jgi:glutaredoxin